MYKFNSPVKGHIANKQHKYIHFIDFSNPNVSICDPYCVGLLKQHNIQKRSFFYDASNILNYFKKENHPSILNRFYLDKRNGQIANYSLTNGEAVFEKNKFDREFLNHFLEKGPYQKFRVIFIYYWFDTLNVYY